MEARRVKLFKKFTTKTSENARYKSWFPLKESVRDTRNPRPYLEERATSDRLFKSPIYAMRRLLNMNQPIPPDLSDLSGAFNAP